ncbi:thiolase C-terminal domain-containing protein [Streptomyces sp. 900116325]
MGIAISQEQQELAQSVRGWLARAVPPAEIRKLLDASASYAPGVRPDYRDGLAEQGLLALHLPEGYGGGGGALLDLAVVLEETGRAALPGPYLATALASALLGGAEASELARALADGTRIGAVALGPGTLTAVESEGGHLLDGVAPPVLSGADADLLLLPAASAGATRWFAVDSAAEGLTVRPHRGADPTRPTAEVRVDGVLVPAARAVRIDSGTVRDLAAVLLAAEACGTAAWALDTAVAYAQVREQFGRPIGQFQGIKHLCADMLVRVEQSRALVWDAARAADRAPETRALVAALAAGTALDAAHSCAKDCIQILGGIGFTWEHDAHLHLRRAVVVRQLLGAGDVHRLRAARLAEGGARRELSLELPAEAARHRAEARETVAADRGLDPEAARRALAPTGYAAPHLPAPYGLDAGPVQQLAVQQELAEQGVKVSGLGIATWVPMSRAAAQQVYDASGLSAADLDVIELHDCFSINELLTYEALGLCGEGESGKLVESGATTYGGRWVVNPSGGLISKEHPLGATGIAQAAELVWQLRGEAGPRQVPDARVGLAHNIGLGGAAVVTLLRR